MRIGGWLRSELIGKIVGKRGGIRMPGGLFLDDPITNPRLRQEVDRLRRIILELAAQARHVDAKVMRLIGLAGPPRIPQ